MKLSISLLLLIVSSTIAQTTDDVAWLAKSKADLQEMRLMANDSTTLPVCPVCGDTATWPNLPLTVGNDDKYFGSVCWLPSVRVFICDGCGCLFVRQEGKKYKIHRVVQWQAPIRGRSMKIDD